MTSRPGAHDLHVVNLLMNALAERDATACSAVLAEDVTYNLVSQYEHRGRRDVVDAFLREAETTTSEQDLFCADGSGRVWWRYTGRWTDAETGHRRSATGATVVHVEGDQIASMMSWIDVVAATVDAPEQLG
jgi:hypothetical protein